MWLQFLHTVQYSIYAYLIDWWTSHSFPCYCLCFIHPCLLLAVVLITKITAESLSMSLHVHMSVSSSLLIRRPIKSWAENRLCKYLNCLHGLYLSVSVSSLSLYLSVFDQQTQVLRDENSYPRSTCLFYAFLFTRSGILSTGFALAIKT